MSFLVDTNVFSESAKRSPDPKVIAWLREHESRLYLSTITVGEVRGGIELLPEGKRKSQLRDWLSRITGTMKGLILSCNVATANVWGQLKAKWDRAGLNIPALDGQIAATAHRRGLVVITRKVRDFEGTGVQVHNPFEG
jgi:predicted nucleic acid-binding protein